jgi:hypothetical protein
MTRCCVVAPPVDVDDGFAAVTLFNELSCSAAEFGFADALSAWDVLGNFVTCTGCEDDRNSLDGKDLIDENGSSATFSFGDLPEDSGVPD